MSYILEALRRAERERERGQVPGLHDQTLPPIAASSRRPRWPVVAAAGLSAAAGAAALLALGWRLGAEAPAARSSAASAAGAFAGPAEPAEPPATAAPAAAVAPIAPLTTVGGDRAPQPGRSAPDSTRAAARSPARPAASSEASGAGTAAAGLAAVASGVPAGPLVPAPGRREAQQRGSAAEPAAAVASRRATPAASAALALPGPSASAAAARAAAPNAPRAVPLAELSPAERAELPPLAIGGAVYSESAASRFVLVNGQVVHEGEAAAPGVTLERIGPRSAVLRWRERRIELPL